MRALIVEDEKELANVLKKGLREENFSVDIAYDGDKGSYLARTNEYDVIILDNMLPQKTGLEVCKEIRENGITVPIIMLSAVEDTQTKIELLNSGADDYVTKPFSFGELMARINAVRRRPEKVEGDVLAADDLVLDVKKGTVTRGGKNIRLTRKEYGVLEYLMRNPDVIVSRNMLMEHVWDMNADPFSNTIEAHIVSLRKKIDKNGRKKLIHTIWVRHEPTD